MDTKTPVFTDYFCCGGPTPSAHDGLETTPWARVNRAASTVALGGQMSFRVKAREKHMEWYEPDLDEEEKEERMAEVHRLNAEAVYQHITAHRGFFVKIGQRLSTSPTVPEAYQQTLEPLQDQLPHSSWNSVSAILLADFGRPVEELFSEFEKEPIASASIGQAHVARLHSGEKVCVKVEHYGVKELCSMDLETLSFMAKMMTRLHEEAPDFTEVFLEMKRASLEEVDFRLEAQNAIDALEALHRAGMDVNCPQPIMHLCSPRVLTMKFIEGWKISQVDRLPENADREELALRTVEAFAYLIFDIGLVHGDPHPGNVFVEPLASGGLRPVLLDWGIVKRLSRQERVIFAKWVVACLSGDRFLYLSTLEEMGWPLVGDVDCEQLDLFMFLGKLSLRDSVPKTEMKSIKQQFQRNEETHRDRQKSGMEEQGKKMQQVFEKIPGWIIYFFRGLDMMQNICSMLGVMVPMAQVMLRFAMPVLTDCAIPAVLAPCRNRLEAAVCETLQQCGALGGQVAVLRGSDPDWTCSVAFGQSGAILQRVSEESLVPLLDISVGVLTACLLARLSQPTHTGKVVGLDSAVAAVWPQFTRAGKGGLTLRQLLSHQARLTKPFTRKTTYKSFCNEQHMEDNVASCPMASVDTDEVCKVLGVAIAAVLRRVTGHQRAAEAVKSVLEPLGLQEDIVYFADDARMSRVAHTMIDRVTLAHIFEALDSRQGASFQDEGAKTAKKLPPWLSYQEMIAEQPWCADPLLVNSRELRRGSGCATGRGLRGTAKAVCKFLASDAIDPDLLAQSRTPRKLAVRSREEWIDGGRCLEVGAGWQILRFKRLDGSGEVEGWGHVDGSTGSVAVRVQDASIVVLLTCVDLEAPDTGRAVLSIISEHLGLAPLWYDEEPTVPDKSCLDAAETLVSSSDATLRDAFARLEAQVLRSAEVCQRLEAHLGQQTGSGRSDESCGVVFSRSVLCGSWASAEIQGLDVFLDALSVPTVFRALAKKLQIALRIDVDGDAVTMASTIKVAGRQVEQETTSFQVGQSFEGQTMGSKFRGTGCWAGDTHDALEVTMERTTEIGDLPLVLVDRFSVGADGRLAMERTVRGQGVVEVALRGRGDCEALRRVLDPQSLRVTAEAQVGTSKLRRGGLLVAISNGEPLLSSLATVELPSIASLQYDDLTSTILFDPKGGQPIQRNMPTNSGIAGTSVPQAQILQSPKPRSPPCCLPCRSVQLCLASVFFAMARYLQERATDSVVM